MMGKKYIFFCMGALSLPFLLLAEAQVEHFAITLEGPARFTLELPDSSVHGANLAGIVNTDTYFEQYYDANRQVLGTSSVGDGGYSISFDASREREVGIELQTMSASGSEELRFDYYLRQNDTSSVDFSFTDGLLILSESFNPPKHLRALREESSDTSLTWDAHEKAVSYEIYHRPDTFPFYKYLGSTASTSFVTEIPWAEFRQNAFSENLTHFAVAAIFENGNYSVFSNIVSNDDVDGDGVSDQRELQQGTDPAVTDSDGDGLDDFYEINQSLTDPLTSDTDGDGFADGEEISAGTSPHDPDSYPQTNTGDSGCLHPGDGDWIIQEHCLVKSPQSVEGNIIVRGDGILELSSGIHIKLDGSYNIHINPGGSVILGAEALITKTNHSSD